MGVNAPISATIALTSAGCSTAVHAARSMLGSLVADSPGPHHAVTLLRGAQAAFELRGWRLELRNLPFSVGPVLTATPFTPAVAARIRHGIAHPVRAAALATALFSGLTSGELSQLLRLDLDPNAETITASSTLAVLAIPSLAQPMLRAARTYLTLHAVDGFILFTGGLGVSGQGLRRSADACRIPLPARHRWSETWLANATTSPTDRHREVRFVVSMSVPVRHCECQLV
ncbi:hypothetical protein [Nocardia sp. NPDC004711]